LDQLPASLTPEARAAEATKIAAEVKDSIRSDATQATIRRQIIVRDTFDADKRIGRGQALSSVDLARLNAAPTAQISGVDVSGEIVVTGYKDDADRVQNAKLGLIQETGQAVGVVTKVGGGTVEGVGTGVINNAKDTLGLLKDSGGYLINKATFGTTNNETCARVVLDGNFASIFGVE
jgi:hypothetical protein